VPKPREAADDRPQIDPGRLWGLLGFHLRLAQVTMQRGFTEALAGLDLTQKQCATLELIAANPGVSQVDIASRLRNDRATMMALIDRLEERGLVARRRSAADRRRQELTLTADGEALLGQAMQAVEAHERRFTARFSAAELETLVELLGRVRQAP
jgi:MarR family transcriptional regulator, organic hydroperoxide resistance regulator